MESAPGTVLSHLLGESLAAYVSGLEPEGSEAPVLDGAHLTTDQRTAQEQAAAFLVAQAETGVTDFVRTLCQVEPETGKSHANRFRELAGGAAPSVDAEDPFTRCLLSIGTDTFPSLLGKAKDESFEVVRGIPWGAVRGLGGLPAFLHAVLDHPQADEFQELAAADEDFGPILGNEQEGGPLLELSLGGTAHQRELFAHELIIAAAETVIAQGFPLRPEVFLSTLRENVARGRALIRGEQSEVFVVVGIVGLRLDQGIVIRTPWGDVRRPAPRVQAYRPFGISADAVLALPILERLTITPPGEMPSPERGLGEGQQRLARAHKLLPLSVLLARDNDPPTVPFIAWSTQLSPLAPSAGVTGGTPGSMFLPDPPEVSNDEARSIEAWAQLVNERHGDSIDIAARRIVSAVGHRADAQDSLVDAVMAWENLFGAATETSWRVTAALAHLLERDPQNRVARRKQLAKTYAARSRVVHGGAMQASELAKHRAEATTVAIAALRAAYSRFPQLLKVDSSEERTALLLLGVTGPAEEAAKV